MAATLAGLARRSRARAADAAAERPAATEARRLTSGAVNAMRVVSVVAEPIAGRIRPELAIVSSLGEHVVGQYVLVRMTDDAGRVGLGEASVTSRLERRNANRRHRPDPRRAGAAGRRRRPVRHGMDRPPTRSGRVRQQLRQGRPRNGLARSARPDPRRSACTSCSAAGTHAAPDGDSVEIRGRRRGAGAGGRAGAADGRARLEGDQGEGGPARASAQSTWSGCGRCARRSGRTCSCRWTPTAVTRSSRRSGRRARLEKLDVALFEQPTRRGDHAAMAEVRRRCGMPIMADESVFTAAGCAGGDPRAGRPTC